MDGWLTELGKSDPFPFQPQSAERNQLERCDPRLLSDAGEHLRVNFINCTSKQTIDGGQREAVAGVVLRHLPCS